MAKSKVRNHAILNGYRSGLEEVVSQELTSKGVGFSYEKLKIKYIRPSSTHTYTPDFELTNGIIVETKGRFVTADRRKHLEVQAQHPELDIRFVFSNSKGRISKLSLTTYADWCKKNNFKYADKSIPEAWINEKKT